MVVVVDPEAVWDQGRVVQRLSYEVVNEPLVCADACGAAVAAEAITDFVTVLGLGVMVVEQGLASCGEAAMDSARLLGAADDAARGAWVGSSGVAPRRV